MEIFENSKKMLQNPYSFFYHNPRRWEELFSLANVIKQKIYKYSKMLRRIGFFFINPMRWLLAKYRSALGKAHADKSEIAVTPFSLRCPCLLCCI
jgi:hypothetical protein